MISTDIEKDFPAVIVMNLLGRHQEIPIHTAKKSHHGSRGGPDKTASWL
jgi:hypothetical protein